MMATTVSAQTVTSTSSKYDEFKEALLSKDVEKAKEVLKSWEEERPNDPELYCSHATLHAVLASQEIKESDDLTPEALNNTVMLPDTIALFKNMKVDSYFILKDSGNGMEHFKQAIQWMEKCITEYPNLGEAYLNCMEVFNQKKEFKYSTKLAFKFIDQSVKNNNQWVGYALQPADESVFESVLSKQLSELLEAAQSELSEKMIDHALSLYPDKAILYLLKGAVYEHSMQIEKLMQCYEKAAELDPNNYGIKYYLLMFNLRQGNKDRINELAHQLLHCGHPEIEDQIFAMGYPYIDKKTDKKNSDKYIQLFERLSEMQPDKEVRNFVENQFTTWEKENPNDIELLKLRAIYNIKYGEAVKGLTENENDNYLEVVDIEEQLAAKPKEDDKPNPNDCYLEAEKYAKQCQAANPDRKDIYTLLFKIGLSLKDGKKIHETALSAIDHIKTGNPWLQEFDIPADSNFSDLNLFEYAMNCLYDIESTDLAKQLLTQLHTILPPSDFFSKWDKALKTKSE